MKTCICNRCKKVFESKRTATACSSACRNWLYVQAHKEKNRKQLRESYHRRKEDPSNIKKYLLKYAKTRASRKGLPFSLLEDDLILPEICPILGVKLDKNTYKHTYSIDRINPDLGYTKENIQIISHLANSMKWNSTREERIAFAKWVLSSEGGNSANDR